MACAHNVGLQNSENFRNFTFTALISNSIIHRLQGQSHDGVLVFMSELIVSDLARVISKVYYLMSPKISRLVPEVATIMDCHRKYDLL